MILKHRRLFIILSGVVLLIFVMGKAYYDTHSIEIRHYEIKNSPLGEALNGLKVAHLSDLHIRSIGLMEKRILEILIEERPDLVLDTGDLISFRGPYAPVMSFYHQLKPPLGIYAVLGNTEYSNENGSCILCHEERSKSLKKNQHPMILRNSSFPLKVNGRTLNIIGVNDPVNKKSNLRRALMNANPENPSVLLAHSPQIFEEASGFDIDLLLCGHTHGGQIFLTKYLRKILPLESSLEFIEGFFQKGKMLMYVSRGVGTSYLPFRFGVKPEITFFTFSSNPMNPRNSSNPSNPSNPLQISNNPSKTIFTGLSLSNLIGTFNILKHSDLFRPTGAPHSRSILDNPGNSANSMNPTNPSNPTNAVTLFDFESNEELNQLDWECHKWFELSEENATSGKYSLKVSLPPGQYPGIHFQKIRTDWSGAHYLRMDVFNPANERVNFHIRIDDRKSGLEYANRFDADFELKQGLNQISIPVDSIRTNLHHHPLNLKRIKQMIVCLTNNTKRKELYLDNIRLEKSLNSTTQ